jgi:elongation factor Ts
MPEITAAAVKALRERTGLPMMDCKKALQETGGDEAAAEEHLRKQGRKTQETRIGRETSTGRIAIYADVDKGVGAMVELMCESAPVAANAEFRQLANDLAKQLATGPGAATAEELLAQPSPSKPGSTLAVQKDDLFNRMREVMKVGRILRINAPTGGYAHHDGTLAALVEVSGGNNEAAKEVAMHVTAQKPQVVAKEDLDPADIERERDILSVAARGEGKPENIIAKMVEGRLRNFFSERVLLEQPFVKDDKQTVGQVAKKAGMTIKRFVRWELGKE